ncbi:MAG TPA: DUF1841 family protein [Burkholderiales bacterium]|mgnify:CR=1 FL=1|nr:DUF1841 family protein [Burkholderiales bacterium]
MFNPSLNDVRNFFFDIYAKSLLKQPLAELEKIAYKIILEHPEYHYILENREKYIQFQWLPEIGEINPFLHLSMHLSIIEQLSINQPTGIIDLYDKLLIKSKPHHAQHELMDCLGEMLWQAERNKTLPDINLYLTCIKKKLEK